jgi:pimeloyl-ACP methyl ester carboxylesterase
VDKYLKFVELFAGQLDLNSFFLIGHSFGGGLALAFSALNSQSVKMLVLCDAAVIRTERLDWRQSCAKKMVWAKNLVINMPFFKNIRPLAQKIIYKIAGVHDYHKATPLMKETFNNIIEEDLQKYAGSIRIPVLIAWGERDKSTPIEDAYTLQHLIPGSRIETIKGIGHNPHREAPVVLTEKIINFFKTK